MKELLLISMKVTVMTKASTGLSVKPLAFIILIWNEKLRASAILADVDYSSDVKNLSRGALMEVFSCILYVIIAFILQVQVSHPRLSTS